MQLCISKLHWFLEKSAACCHHLRLPCLSVDSKSWLPMLVFSAPFVPPIFFLLQRNHNHQEVFDLIRRSCWGFLHPASLSWGGEVQEQVAASGLSSQFWVSKEEALLMWVTGDITPSGPKLGAFGAGSGQRETLVSLTTEGQLWLFGVYFAWTFIRF